MRAKQPPWERCTDLAGIRVLFAGGGTGGHLFPAIAIAEEVKRLRPDAEILFVGTEGKIEARVVPRQGFAFRTIWISGFQRRLKIRNLLVPVKLGVSMIQSYFILRSFKPGAVVGTGGYVSGPVLFMATRMRIPTLIQEQNSVPGETTRLLASRANEVHLTFERSRELLSRVDNTFVSGNPTRGGLENVDRAAALRSFGFDPEDASKTVLVFGGSLGAHSINEAVRTSLAQIMEIGIRLIWQTGERDYEAAKHAGSKMIPARFCVMSFIERMDLAYAASDLVVCRAGATTIAELTRLGKPAVLVPYPGAAANHQVENAKTMHSLGAAEMVYDHELGQGLMKAIAIVLDDARLASMSAKSRILGHPEAAAKIAHRVVSLAEDNPAGRKNHG